MLNLTAQAQLPSDRYSKQLLHPITSERKTGSRESKDLVEPDHRGTGSRDTTYKGHKLAVNISEVEKVARTRVDEFTLIFKLEGNIVFYFSCL